MTAEPDPRCARRATAGEASVRARGAVTALRQSQQRQKMADWIEVHPERFACRFTWLHRMPSSAELQQLGLDRVDIVDGQVQVELLRSLSSRPRRRCVLVSQLKRHAEPVDRKDDPVIIRERDLSPDDTLVELGKCPRVGAVEDHGSHAGECHGQSLFHKVQGRLLLRPADCHSLPTSPH